MKTKIYNFGGVDYNYSVSARKWVFVLSSTNTVLVNCGGKDNADKVAHIVVGALKRTKGIGLDNLARSNISQVTQ